MVDLLDDDEDLEVELATSLLYGCCHYSYRQLRGAVAALSETRRNEILALGAKHRGKHDELLRSFHSGHGFRFDILMDIGAFRDMHRHRRCVQLIQEFTDVHGYDEPICPGQPTLAEAGLDSAYKAAMAASYAAYNTLAASPDPEAKQSAQYLLPLGTRLPRHVQNGLRRSPLHRRAPLRHRRPLQLPLGRLEDVPGHRHPPPRPRPPLPHRGRKPPRRPAQALKQVFKHFKTG